MRRFGASLAFVCMLAMSFACVGAETNAPAKTNLFGLRATKLPNIIFIVADGLGYGDLGCYGQTKIVTTNIDALAKEGMRFTQFYAGSSVSAPSRASQMTGLHTGHTTIRGDEPAVPLRAEDLTVAEILKNRKYVTVALGEWGLGLPNTTGTPNNKGFDEFFGFLSQSQAEDYYPVQLFRNTTLVQRDKNLYGNKGEYSQDVFSMVASNAVRINKYFPLFLYFASPIPHANTELAKKTGNGMEVPSDKPYSDEKWPQPEKNRAAMITRLDAAVGALMKQLHDLRIEEDTVIIFTSANGPQKEGGVDPKFFNSTGPLRGLKGDLYEGGIRVPMIVRWPAKIPAGSVSDQVWAFWDFLPTAAEIAGATPPAGIDGISMLPTLLGQKQTNQHEFLYWEVHEQGSKQAVRMGDWKAVRLEPGKPLELYNLKEDVAEANNVADKHPDVVAKIEAYLKTARTESERWPLKKSPAGANDPQKKAEVKQGAAAQNVEAKAEHKPMNRLIFPAVIGFAGVVVLAGFKTRSNLRRR